ncbi:MAG TPA: hypothetical protein VK186_27130 [Candidatus Deferrimicrobium sp.]|nr:hypothetical protein [Candidatus Kapabacteria bacterium]HLP62542.1 hypothetical protein [Candidatus Deferrimicrobium sp.]
MHKNNRRKLIKEIAKRTAVLYRLPLERIYEEIMHYLKTRRSRYFKFKPSELREEAILRVFRNTSSENLRNKFRQAIYLCLAREKLFTGKFRVTSRLIDLAREMKVNQAEGILVELARAPDESFVSAKESMILKNQAIETLIEFDISKAVLKEIIDNNIFNPNYTEICLIASTKLIPRYDSFLDYFPIALSIYQEHPDKINLSGILSVGLTIFGDGTLPEF